MIDRIGFTLISAVITITLVSIARDRTINFNDGLSTAVIPGGSFDSSRRSIYEPDLLDNTSILVSSADPLVLQAGEVIRNAFNSQRTAACASINLYNARGTVQYAKRAEMNGTVYYTLEVAFGGEVVFSRVKLLPKSLSAKFQLIFSIPGPCESGVQEQLAVSAFGT